MILGILRYGSEEVCEVRIPYWCDTPAIDIDAAMVLALGDSAVRRGVKSVPLIHTLATLTREFPVDVSPADVERHLTGQYG